MLFSNHIPARHRKPVYGLFIKTIVNKNYKINEASFNDIHAFTGSGWIICTDQPEF